MGHDGWGHSTTIPDIQTIVVPTSTVEIQPYQPPFSRSTYMPVSPKNIVGPPRTNPGPSLSFMASINLPDLARLMNDSIYHDPLWPPMPTKIPLDIPKFEGKAREDSQNHTICFHL